MPFYSKRYANVTDETNEVFNEKTCLTLQPSNPYSLFRPLNLRDVISSIEIRLKQAICRIFMVIRLCVRVNGANINMDLTVGALNIISRHASHITKNIPILFPSYKHPKYF